MIKKRNKERSMKEIELSGMHLPSLKKRKLTEEKYMNMIQIISESKVQDREENDR